VYAGLAMKKTFFRSCALLACALCGLTARGDMILITGTVTQDLADSGETAIDNPALNQINDGDSFTVALGFAGSASDSGLTGTSSVLFTDNTASVSENGFISGVMDVSLDSGEDQLSVLACLLDPVSCTQGNQLDLNFQIAAAGFNQSGVTAQFIPGLTPALDLLEDGGNTEIQGSITGYSYIASTSAVPEPSTLPFAGEAMAWLILLARVRNNRFKGGKR
jgi:hypothetical protein